MTTEEVKQLRLGNLVINNYNPDQIIAIDTKTFVDIFRHPQRYSFVEITEERLIKAGFEKKGKRFSKDWLYLWDEWGTVVFALAEMHDEVGTYLPIQYAHRLQNLYNDLTGKELTL